LQLAAFGLRAVGAWAVPVEALERLDALLRAAPKQGSAVLVADQDREALGWTEAQLREVLKALGYTTTAKPKPGEPQAWRRRNDKPKTPKIEPAAPATSPFAALAALKAPPPRPAKPAGRRPKRRRPGKATS